MSIIETTKLTKVYDNVPVVNNVNLKIEEGQIFGFLGPNGAGKTTTILMLLGLTVPTSGKAIIAGFDSTRDALKVKKMAGYVPEKVGFYNDMSARQNLLYTANLNGVFGDSADKAVNQALIGVGLKDRMDDFVGRYSKGMRQRLAIADILVKTPKVAFLDEPTSGIDPEGINQILDLISQIAKTNAMTIVVSSHQLSQVQRICTHVGIMSKGKLVSSGSIVELSKQARGGKIIIEVQLAEFSKDIVESIGKIPGVTNVKNEENMLTIACNDDLRQKIAKVISDKNGLITKMDVRGVTLDDIYMRIVQGA